MAVKEKARETKNYIKDVEIVEPSKKKEEKKIEKQDKKLDKKKEVKKTHKRGFFGAIRDWFKSVIKELKLVKWPSKKEMVKNSIATIIFIIFFAVFFLVIEIGVSLLLEYFG